MASKIRTRILILSDTHGEDFNNETRTEQHVDVALHCGDLTNGSLLEEFRTTIETLKLINAPRKLIIAGNHDFSLDSGAFNAIVNDSESLDRDDVDRYHGPRHVRQLLDDAKEAGVEFLDEGTYAIDLENGARLTIYASPYTPSLGGRGFQYDRGSFHKFDIKDGTDIVMTHGPPEGIFDRTHNGGRAGCPHLFEAIDRARPLVHCFGHIHEGWGARLVAWKGSGSYKRSHFTAIDNGNSFVIENLGGLRERALDSEAEAQEKRAKLETLRRERCATTSHCASDEHALRQGRETIFINAAIRGTEEFVQRPWIIDIDLPPKSDT